MGDAADEEVLLSTPAHLNVNKISRQLRRSDLSLRNCLHSVDVDAAWVAHLAACFPGLPVVANLRCGLWYTREAQATAYFKVRPSCGLLCSPLLCSLLSGAWLAVRTLC